MDEQVSSSTHLDNVSKNLIRDGILLLHLRKLLAESQRVGLEVQVGVLPARNLVFVDVRVAGFHGDRALERRVQQARLLPVGAVLVNSLGLDAWTQRYKTNVKRNHQEQRDWKEKKIDRETGRE